MAAVAAPTLIAAEHLHRYEFAAGLCAGMRVVDLCCGSGYGVEILAKRAAAVHGVDYDAATIDLAADTFAGRPAITVELADAGAFLRADLRERFDAIVCFEGLEHLPDVELALGELARHAAAGIAVIASVPNSRGLAEENEFHVTEFGYAEALAAFARFPGGVVVHQYLAEGSVILVDGAGDLDARLHGLERAEPPYANHFLVVTGSCAEGLGGDHAARVQVALAPNHNRYMKTLENANAELRRRNTRLARGLLGKSGSAAPAYVRQAEQRLAELTEHLDAQTAQAHDLRRELDHRQRRIGRLEEQLEHANREAEPLRTQPAPKGLIGQIARRLRGF